MQLSGTSTDSSCFSSYCSSASDTRQRLCSTRYRCNSPVHKERSAQCCRESCGAGPWHARCCKSCPSASAVLGCHLFAELLRISSPSQVPSTCASCWEPPALHASASTSRSLTTLAFPWGHVYEVLSSCLYVVMQ